MYSGQLVSGVAFAKPSVYRLKRLLAAHAREHAAPPSRRRRRAVIFVLLCAEGSLRNDGAASLDLLKDEQQEFS